jgi:hypothetical protein
LLSLSGKANDPVTATRARGAIALLNSRFRGDTTWFRSQSVFILPLGAYVLAMPSRLFVTVKVGYQQDDVAGLTHLRELIRRSAEHCGLGSTWPIYPHPVERGWWTREIGLSTIHQGDNEEWYAGGFVLRHGSGDGNARAAARQIKPADPTSALRLATADQLHQQQHDSRRTAAGE